MRSIKQINELGGTKINLRTREGKNLLGRMAEMPIENKVVHPLLGWLSMKHYIVFLEYPEEHLQ
ncbi:hypothetical protein LCGC14_1195840 [marine sediment metagenome]|uniref:Uncharacterized protein n=1 Tax=marine sediment metagenome TaxID=412755 RepID=A0A0F9LMW0_9ZZZZ